MIKVIDIPGYEQWFAATGEYGYCKNPTKTKRVGTLFECTEDWNGDKLIVCAIATGLCISPCVMQLWPTCVACLGVTLYGCAEGGLCSFVDACIPDPDSAFPIEKEVVDMGADWGDLTKCP
jgi:hypothetical protein